VNGLGRRAQVRGWIERKLCGQCDNNRGHQIAAHEGVDAALQDRDPAEREQLFRAIGAEAKSAPAGGDDGGDV
jgi:hypothetical protein